MRSQTATGATVKPYVGSCVCYLKGKMKEARYGAVLLLAENEIKIRSTNNNFEHWIPRSCILHVSSGRVVTKPKPAFLPPIVLEGAADKLLKQIRRQPILMPKRRKLIDNRKVRTQHIWKLLLALSRLEKLPTSSWDSLTNVDLDHIAGIFRQRGFVKLAYVGRPLFRRYKRVWSAIGRERKRRDPEFDGKMNALRKGRPSRWEALKAKQQCTTDSPS